AELRAAIGLEERLMAEFPDVPRHRGDLADSHNNLGLLLEAMKKWGQADKEYRTAIDLHTKLTADFPTFPEHTIGLGGTFCNLGHLERDRGRLKHALAWYAQAIATLSPVVEQEPRLGTARRFLLNSHWGRATTLDRLEQHGHAAEDWARAMSLAPEKNP